MSILIFAILVIIIAVLAIYAVERIDIDARLNRLLQALILIVAALAIAGRAGLI